MHEYLPPSPPAREEPVTSFPPPSPSPSGRSGSRLLTFLIGGAVCLALAAFAAAVLGVGWMAYDEIQYTNATATAEAQLPPPGWSLVIDEAFVSNQNDWDVGPQESEYGSAYLALEDECYQWQFVANSDAGMSWWAFPFFDHRLADFYASMECRLVGGNVSDSDCGLAFRILDAENYYTFVVAGDQLVNIAVFKKGEWIELFPWEYTDLVRPDGVNRLAVLAKGTHYKFFINGQLVHELDDDRLATGKVGMLADVWGENEAEFQFDNFQVYEQ